MAVTLLHGDALEVLRTLPDCSVDAIVTDPPYGLSNAVGRERMSNRIYEALFKIGFPQLYQRHTELLKDAGLDFVSANGVGLGGELRAVGEVAGVSVPERAINFNGNFAINQEINNGDISAGGGVSDCILPDEVETEPAEFLGNFILKLRGVDAAGFTLNECGGCIAEAFTGGFAVPIFAESATGCPSFEAGGVSVVFGNDVVGLADNAASESKTAPFVLALGRTVNTLMLRFDVRGWPVELLATHRTSDFNGVGFEGGAELVRADATASSLASISKPSRVRFVVNTADGTRSFFFHVLVPLNTNVGKIIPSGGFMGKNWDAVLPDPQVWRELLRVVKPGGHLLSFGGTRTYHRLACDIEDAGFEIRDTVYWCHGQGFPKSHNLGDGRGSALKPAIEPITMARKPITGTIAANVLEWGVGALNIDKCRVGTDTSRGDRYNGKPPGGGAGITAVAHWDQKVWDAPAGRWPAHLIHDGSDEVVAMFPQTQPSGGNNRRPAGAVGGILESGFKPMPVAFESDNGGSAARFFYVAKASKRDRDEGLDRFEARQIGHNLSTNACARCGKRVKANGSGDKCECGELRETVKIETATRNHHPTVKPTALMQYLCRLITPAGGVVLDPFAGSGSTGKGAVLEGFNFIGIEREQDYIDIARARIAWAEAQVRQLELGVQS